MCCVSLPGKGQVENARSHTPHLRAHPLQMSSLKPLLD